MKLNQIIIFTLISLLATYFLVPIINKFGKNNRFLDYPNLRKQHSKPIVRIGGLAIILGWLITLLAIFVFNFLFLGKIFFDDMKVYVFIFSAIFVFLIGFFDDIKGLSPYSRLFFQFLVSTFCFKAGFYFDFSDISFIYRYVDSPLIINILNYLFTTFYIVGLTNAVNWWDGLDGLASGVISISAFFLLLINFSIYGFIDSSNNFIVASLIGASLGFLIHNYKPAKILMGDGGAYFLGFSLACLTLLNNPINSIILESDFSIFFIKLLPILVSFPFLIDMARVIFIRLLSSKLLVKPDRLHLHHNLLYLGLSEKKTVNQIYALVAYTNSFPLLISIDRFTNSYIFSFSLIFFVFTYVNFKKIF